MASRAHAPSSSDPAPPPDAAASPPVTRGLDPAGLPSPISGRRAAMVAIGLVVALVGLAFGRQVGDASAASARSAELQSTNAALRAELSALQSNLATVQGEQYVGVACRRTHRARPPFESVARRAHARPSRAGSICCSARPVDRRPAPRERALGRLIATGR
jgi:hypothetical protein